MNGKNKLKPQKAVIEVVEVVEVEQPKKTRKKKADVQTEDKEGE
jgi:hypothetical protein